MCVFVTLIMLVFAGLIVVIVKSPPPCVTIVTMWSSVPGVNGFVCVTNTVSAGTRTVMT